MREQPIYGLIGYPLSHSFSQKYFTEKFENESIDACYLNFELPDLSIVIPKLKANVNIIGLNVTIPYKRKIFKFLDDIDDVARRIDAVNVISIKHGKWIGHNTDWIGFVTSLKQYISKEHQQALILGDGGAAQAVKFGLNSLGISFKSVIRSEVDGGQYIHFNDLTADIIKENPIIINTTPLGTFPDIDTFPDIPYEGLSAKHVCFDLVYNPLETSFLKLAKSQNAIVINGLEMLKIQAEEAWRIWNNN